MYIEKTLKSHPYANCKIIITDEYIYLKSYNTIILKYCITDYTLSVSGLYSSTTRKHIGYWLKEVLPGVSYSQVKKAYENNYSIYTGGIRC